MGVLRSQLFTEGDPDVLSTLENCATGQPNELSSHFAQDRNQNGEHIRRVQQALKNVQQRETDLKTIPDFTINGNYDENFARAVAAYKTKRRLFNFEGKIDRIVGIKTLRALDKDNPPAKPPAKPPVQPTPNVVPPPEIPRVLPG